MNKLIVRVACGLGIPLLAATPRAGAETTGAGWRGPYQDGCYYRWDGQQFTGYDCTRSSVYGWYGPYEDGCFYLWDGYRFIAADCNQPASTVSTGRTGNLEIDAIDRFADNTIPAIWLQPTCAFAGGDS